MDERELSDDPLTVLRAWLDEARELVPLPEAMTLATVGPDGRPSARIVLRYVRGGESWRRERLAP